MAPQRFPSLRSGSTGRPRSETATATGPHYIPHTPVTTTTTTNATLDSQPEPAPAPAPAPAPGLIALPYEQTAQAQPPILLPPPRNPLRASRRPPASSAQLPSSPAPPEITTATTRTKTTTTSDLHVVPPPVPAREQHLGQADVEHPRLHLRLHLPVHPAVRRQCQSNHSPASSTSTTASTAASSVCADWRRDSLLGTLSSASATLHEEDEEEDDEDAFRYDYHVKLHVVDTPSIYSTDEPTPALSSDEPCTPQHTSRPSFQSRWSVTDSDTSEIASVNLPRDTATKRLVKGLSLKLPPPPMKRLRKKSLTEGAVAPTPPHSPQSHHSGLSQPSPAPHLSPSPNAPDSVRDSRQEIRHFDSHIQSPNPSGPRPLSERPQPPPQSDFHPINTSIPEGRFLDDIDSLNFSKRGSILFGGKRAVSPPNPALGPSAMQMSPTRAAPAPVPAASSADGAPDSKPAAASLQPTPRDSARKLSLPNIRVMSVDTERESQKVRSLYESGDFVNWQDGAPGSPSGEPAESGDQLPPDGEDIVAERRRRQSVRALYLCPNTPLSATSLPSPQGNTRRSEYELAGGIEDWENVQVDDVDRYGFIHFQRPKSRRSIPAETHSLHSTVGRRNGRNVLTKRTDGPSSPPGLSRIPSRKVSARSLNTQTSGVSTSSRFTVRSGIRTAANLLPHNRDRKVIDEAGEMLGLPPGLVDIEEEQKSEQALKDAHEREVKRTEKWRKMAKTFIKGRDDKGVMFAVEDIAKVKRSKGSEHHFEILGTVIEFDVKSPKLIERTWKGIPDCWRGAAWYSFLSASAQKAKSDTTEEQLFAEFHRLQDVSSPDDTQIDLDVPRTINKHIMFRKRYRGGQRLLFRVLHAMSLYFPDTGYVQGMAGLAATMLCYYDEERCFVMLVRLWQFRGLERLYQPGFAGLMLALKDLENHWLHGKAAAQKLNEMGIDPTAYGTRWYLTLFNLSIPFAAQLRVWDVFMLLGDSSPSPDPSAAKEKEAEATFNGLEILHSTSAALIDGQKELIIDADFENVMKALTSAQPVKDEDRFMNVVRAEWNMHRKKRRS
ncbi:hypothetical protein INS49_011359 [Diaporthe citri]|uniref:uncharacterized protein n=1 Tax=Diaporthe citri TaxID=83186 RepID=UPI001C81BAD8|nr:uncharacterized protein INS49_011359 [Diaporthe citri]KAG6360302.1 hypothetical protein INS49_011359 [Diaporthe citri]